MLCNARSLTPPILFADALGTGLLDLGSPSGFAPAEALWARCLAPPLPAGAALGSIVAQKATQKNEDRDSPTN